VRVLMWPPNAKLPRSAPAVLYDRCRALLDMSRSSLGVILRSLPARGDHLGWTIRTMRRVHWSDESRFLLRPTDGRPRVWLQRNTSY
jgi:hypothetical protein